MVQIGRSWSLLGICIFVVAAIVAPFVTHAEYNWMRQPLGELAGQQMPNAWIMRVGFVSLGFGIFFDALLLVVAKKRRDYLPFLVFGVCMIGAGISNVRALDPTSFFAAPIAQSRGLFFIAGIMSLIVGIGWQAYRTSDIFVRRLSIGLVVLLASLLPLLLVFSHLAGLIDRIVVVSTLTWMFFYFGKSK